MHRDNAWSFIVSRQWRVSKKIDHNEMKLESKRNRDAELNEGSYQGSTSSYS